MECTDSRTCYAKSVGTLCTIHNVEFMVRLVDNISAAVDAEDYEAYRDEFLGRYYAGAKRPRV